MRCSKCGSEILEGNVSCKYCGEKFDWLNEYGKRLKENDTKAFAWIYQDSFWRVRREAFQMLVRYESEVDHAVQEIFIKLIEDINQFDSKQETFRSWFHQFVTKSLIDSKKKLDYREGNHVMMSAMEMEEMDGPMEFEVGGMSAIPELQMKQTETSKLIQEILDELPGEQSTCLIMFYFQQMKQEEIAEALDMPKGMVKSYVHYGKIRVEEKVKELERQSKKTYGISLFAFFISLFRLQEKYFMQTNPTVNLEQVINMEYHGDERKRQVVSNVKAPVPKVDQGKNRKITIIVLLVLVVGTLVGMKIAEVKTYNLNKYMTYEIEGYNGDGTCNVSLDTEAITTDMAERVAKKMTEKYSYVGWGGHLLSEDEMAEVIKDNNLAGKWVTVSVDKEDHLSNNDKVTISYKYENKKFKKYGIRFRGKEKTITVENLPEKEIRK